MKMTPRLTLTLGTVLWVPALLLGCNAETPLPVPEAPPADISSQAEDASDPRDEPTPEVRDSEDRITPPQDAGVEPEPDLANAPEEPEDRPECVIDVDCEAIVELPGPCHFTVCDFGACLLITHPDATPCDDGNPCTENDSCTAGDCDGSDATINADGQLPEGCDGVLACEDAVLIDALPYVVDDDNIDLDNRFEVTGCAGPAEGLGAASGDQLYILEVPESGTYAIALLDREDDPNGLDAVLYVYDSCPGFTGTTCLGAQNIAGSRGAESIEVTVEASQRLHIMVDGHSSSENAEGTYTLSVIQLESPELDCTDGLDNDNDGAIDCADPGCRDEPLCLAAITGATCGNPHVVTALPFIFEGSTQDMGALSSVVEESCPVADVESEDALHPAMGLGSDDVFFTFTPSESGSFAFSLAAALSDGTPSADLALSLYEGGCPTGEFTDVCLMAQNKTTAGGEFLLAELMAETPYVLVIDGPSNEHDLSGPFSLRIERLNVIPTGALIFTELMGNPTGDLVNDVVGEWIEMLNTTNEEVQLQDAWLTYRSWDNGSEIPDTPSSIFRFDSSTIIAPQAFMVIGKNDDVAVNGGVQLDATYTGITLSNNGGKRVKVQLVAAAWNGSEEPPPGLIIDEVALASGSFAGNGNGASFQFHHNATQLPEGEYWNDWMYKWCHTPKEIAEQYTPTNFGTPGAPNISCGEIADGPPPMSYETDIRPIFVQYCAPCHTTICLGGGCWDDYEDLTELPAYSCGTNADGEPKTKGECTTIRVHSGSMPQGVGCKGDGDKDKDKPECLTGEELLMLKWWVEGGMQP